MKLSKETIQYIKNMARYERDHTNKSNPLKIELDKLYYLCSISTRFTIEIKRVELIPNTTDLILNYVVKELLIILENEGDEALEDKYGSEAHINLENAIWQYLKDVHKFDPEDHHLLKHTTEEALSFAFNYLGIVL